MAEDAWVTWANVVFNTFLLALLLALEWPPGVGLVLFCAGCVLASAAATWLARNGE